MGRLKAKFELSAAHFTIKGKDMNFLITGGCGFIGTSLIDNLFTEGGHFIRIVDNLSVGTREDLAQACDFIEPGLVSLSIHRPSYHTELVIGDILDDKLAIKVAQGMDIIVHLAANTGVAPSVENPRSDCLNNIIGTLNYLEAARYNRIKRFVFASSGAPVGECEPPIHEELAPHPVSPYGASKLSGEAYCSAYFRTFGIETVSLRFGNVYGPRSGHKNSVVAKFIRKAIQGKIMEIYGDGKQSRDFIYIDDLVQAIRLAAKVDGIGGEVFQIAAGAEATVADLVEKLIPILADAGIKGAEIRYGSPRLGDVLRNFSDTSKANRILGWEARLGLEEGLKRTVDWFTQGLEK